MSKPPHVTRMELELSDLKFKIAKLKNFIFDNDQFKKLNNLEQYRLIQQCGFMESYSKVLDERVKSALSLIE